MSILTTEFSSPFGQTPARTYAYQTLPFRHIPIKSVRPLPPTPISPTGVDKVYTERQISPTSSKPLPSLPPLPALPPLTISMPSISIIPATPLPSTPTSPIPPGLPTSHSSTPTLTDTTPTKSATVSGPPGYKRPRLAPLTVSPDVLQRHPAPIATRPQPDGLSPTCSPSSQPSPGLSPTSPLTPDVPQAPSPTTARRRRLSKLRRHLGESVPAELVFSPRGRSASVALGVPLERVDSGLVFERHENLKMREADQGARYDTDFGTFSPVWRRGDEVPKVDVRKLAESDVTDDEDDDGSVESGGRTDEYAWVVSRASKTQLPSSSVGVNSRRAAQRFSKRWYREKGGSRWEEHDYNDVLKLLRSL